MIFKIFKDLFLDVVVYKHFYQKVRAFRSVLRVKQIFTFFIIYQKELMQVSSIVYTQMLLVDLCTYLSYVKKTKKLLVWCVFFFHFFYYFMKLHIVFSLTCCYHRKISASEKLYSTENFRPFFFRPYRINIIYLGTAPSVYCYNN